MLSYILHYKIQTVHYHYQQHQQSQTDHVSAGAVDSCMMSRAIVNKVRQSTYELSVVTMFLSGTVSKRVKKMQSWRGVNVKPNAVGPSCVM